MANNPKYYLLLLLYLFSAALIIQAVTSAFVDVEIGHHLGIMARLDINQYCGAKGSRIQMTFPHNQRAYHISSEEELNLKGLYSRRLLIGSVAPTCTYNECKGCKYKCRAEQVPVEGNDPMNSPYHYKCVCHR